MIYRNLEIQENIELGPLTTMKLGGKSKFFTTVKSENEAKIALEFAKKNDLPIFILGGGSNTLVRDEGFSGLTIKNEILEIKEEKSGDDKVRFELGAGENWDKFVRSAVLDKGLSGIEAMVFIPGTVGALPVQNVGAYGQEIADVFVSLRALNLESGELEEFSKEDCQFSYRDSIFRNEAFGRYFITSVVIDLNKDQPKSPFYKQVENYFNERNIDLEKVQAQDVLFAVEDIRKEKLPDPAEIASAGSFFKNAIIDRKKAEEIKERFGEKIPLFDLYNGKYKISTGWLIEKTGLKGKEFFGMRVHPKNALVLTNINAENFSDLEAARKKIIDEVKAAFGIEIEQEPLEI